MRVSSTTERRRRRWLAVRGAGWVLAAATAGIAQDGGLVRLQSIDWSVPWAAHHLADLDGGGVDLLAVSRGGAVRVWRGADGAEPWRARPEVDLQLPVPARSLLVVADLLGRGAPQLVVADPRGLTAYPLDGEGAAGVTLVPRARQMLRTGAPRFADLVQDLDQDGGGDLVLPVVAHPRLRRDLFEVWMRQPVADGAAAAPRYRLAARLPMQVRRELAAQARRASDVLRSEWTIPRLASRDVNGDGRADLTVEDGTRRAYHLQRDDGSLPIDADVEVDLATFRDTTPAAAVRPGRTLAGQDRAQLQTRDLDGDAIPDAVIAHRRKVWVFPGGSKGPQFEAPSTILKSADDITALAVVQLDDDERPDLLLVKVVVPSMATLLGGLFGDWEIDLHALGYANVDGRTFDPTPRWKSRIAVRLPSISSILRDPDALLSKFDAVGRRFRRHVTGDLDGDGHAEILLTSADGDRLDLWRGRPDNALAAGALDERLLRVFLFDDDDREWSIDRLVGVLGSLADERVARVTGGRAADAGLPLRSAEEWQLVDLAAADLGGAGRDAVVLVYAAAGAPARRVVDVVAWR